MSEQASLSPRIKEILTDYHRELTSGDSQVAVDRLAKLLANDEELTPEERDYLEGAQVFGSRIADLSYEPVNALREEDILPFLLRGTYCRTRFDEAGAIQAYGKALANSPVASLLYWRALVYLAKAQAESRPDLAEAAVTAAVSIDRVLAASGLYSIGRASESSLAATPLRKSSVFSYLVTLAVQMAIHSSAWVWAEVLEMSLTCQELSDTLRNEARLALESLRRSQHGM